MKRQLLKSAEAANYLGISKSTLYNWIKRKRKLTYSQDPVTRYRYYRKEDLDAFLDARIVR
jgi:excisionase family DNA binding protein